MDILIITMALLTMSFWAYCNIFYQRHLLRHQQGYLIFSVIQWILIFISLVWLWSWLIGIISLLVLLLGGAVLATNFTTNQIYKLLKITPDISLALFGVFVWLLGILLIIKIFI